MKLKKWMMATLSMLCVCLMGVGLSACEKLPIVGKYFGIEYALSHDGTYAEVIGYKGRAKRVRIADTYKGVPVTVIGEEAFEDCEDLKSVVIPDSVTSIGGGAFDGCDSLTFNTYGNCDYLGSKDNPYYALIKASNLNYSKYTIHEETKVIAGGAFSDCSCMANIVIPDSVTSIGYEAFRDCDSLTSVVIGDSVTSIGSYAFYYCDSLTSVDIPDSVTSIGRSAFSCCESLTSVVIPDSVTSIGYRAFYWCSSLTSVVIPDSVTSIDNEAFAGCDSLTSVVIPDSVTSIGDQAFYKCDSLTSVDIPDSVTSIGEGAFSGCTNLRFSEYGNCKYLGNENNPYHALIQASNQNYSNYTIHEETKVIADSAFHNCSRMTNIVIPDSVIEIGDEAFEDCNSLTSVVIGDSVTSIDVWAFSDCASLTSVVIGDSVTSIGGSAFSNCRSFTSVYYKGTASEWEKISIGSYYDTYLTNAALYYYSESQPTILGNYWHYDEEGEIAVW